MAAASAPITFGDFAPGEGSASMAEEAKNTAPEVEEGEDTAAAPGEEAAPVPAAPGEVAGAAVSLTECIGSMRRAISHGRGGLTSGRVPQQQRFAT